ncbi:Potassium transporter 18 [Hordeum vulgare]|nr:Potassium transporter 18 [Hordeum vulgare]
METVSTNEDTRKGAMWELEKSLDQPMDAEAGRLRNMYREKTYPTVLMLQLAFQSLGVVFGDLGTSPLYVLNYAIHALTVNKSSELFSSVLTIRLVCLERDNFSPEPTVDGGVIRFKMKEAGEYPPLSSNKSFFSMVNSEFNGKRKMLGKSLQHLYSSVEIEAALTNIGLSPTLYDISGKSPEVHLNTKMSIDAILSCMY